MLCWSLSILAGELEYTARLGASVQYEGGKTLAIMVVYKEEGI